MKIIAIDFDGTLCYGDYPNIGAPRHAVIERARAEREKGAKLILWTCRGGEKLREALDWCAVHGLEFDAVNENLPETIERFGTDPRKIAADQYWDDRAVIPD